MKDFSFITNSHPAYIESLYQSYLKDSTSVDEDLKKFFEGYDFAVSSGNNTIADQSNMPSESGINWLKEMNVYRLILQYRNEGHLVANTNPIRERRDRQANLDLHFFD